MYFCVNVQPEQRPVSCALFWCLWVLLCLFEEVSEWQSLLHLSAMLHLQDLCLGSVSWFDHANCWMVSGVNLKSTRGSTNGKVHGQFGWGNIAFAKYVVCFFLFFFFLELWLWLSKWKLCLGNWIWKHHWCLYSPTALWLLCQCSPSLLQKAQRGAGVAGIQVHQHSLLLALKKAAVVDCSRPDLWGSQLGASVCHLHPLALAFSRIHELCLHGFRRDQAVLIHTIG